MPLANSTPSLTGSSRAADVGSNRHPVDRMAELKAEIDTLKAEYDDLRQQVIDGDVGKSGSDYHAVVETRERRHIALRDAERWLSEESLERVVTVNETTYVTLVRNGRPRGDR